MKFQNRTVLVTGGAQGLGKGFVQAALDAGAKNVILVDVNTEKGMTTVKKFNDRYGFNKISFLQCDITDKDNLQATFQKAIKAFGNLDIVVNNAGVGGEVSLERIIDVNLTALTRCTNLAIEHMRQDKGGNGGLIVNISSTAGLTVAPYSPVYSASKHGVVGLSRSIAIAVESLGIKVLCLCPSFTKTDRVMRNVMKLKPEVVDGVGLMEVSEVVKAFERLVEEEVNGAVMALTPKTGPEYRFPKKLRKSAKL